MALSYQGRIEVLKLAVSLAQSAISRPESLDCARNEASTFPSTDSGINSNGPLHLTKLYFEEFRGLVEVPEAQG